MTQTWRLAYVLVALALALCVARSAAGDVACSFTYQGSSFELSELRRTNGYRDRDLIDSRERNYSYSFNVCGDVQPPADACKARPSGSGPGPVFQLANTGECVRLGRSAAARSFRLVDAADPSRGVSLTYGGGDLCENVSRSTRLDSDPPRRLASLGLAS